MDLNTAQRAHYISVYNYLKDGIIQGKYDENYVFVETELAAQLGISRTPVREAIKMLKSEGVLKAVPKKGIVCRLFTAKDIAPVYELAGAIEGMAAYCIANRYKELDFTRLEDSTDRMRRALEENNKEDWVQADSDFHSILLEMCDNFFAKESMDRLQVYIQLIRARYTKKRVLSMKISAAQHRETLEAIMLGEAEYARTLVHRHWQSIERQVLDGLMTEG